VNLGIGGRTVSNPLVRVALVITDLEPGGAEKNFVELAAGVDRSRFEPSVYCLAGPPVRRRLLDRLESSGVPVTFFGSRHWRQLPVVVARLYRRLRRDRPALMQTFLFHANMVGRWAARLAGVSPVICGLRVAQRDARWRLWLERRTGRPVARWVCVSRAVAAHAVRDGGLPEDRLVVIPNGVRLPPGDQPRVRPEDLGMKPGRRFALYAGRMAPQKSVETLIEAAARWMSLAPDVDLVLAGDGPQRQQLMDLAQRLGVAGGVHFVGFREDVETLLASAALVVHAAAWEGMANSILEAMAAGRAVVAAEAEGMRELLEPVDPRQLVPVKDPEAMALRTAEFLSNPALAGAVGAANRRRAAEFFSIEAMVSAYQRLWGELLAG